MNLIAVALAGLVAVAGCGGGNRLDFASKEYDLRVSLPLPKGWASEGGTIDTMAGFVDNSNPDNHGFITIWPSDGKDLNTWVDEDYLKGAQAMAKMGEAMGAMLGHMAGEAAGDAPREAFGFELVSREPTAVGKWQAVEVVEQASGMETIRVFVRKDDAICEISFTTLPEQWDKNEPLFRASLDGMKIR